MKIENGKKYLLTNGEVVTMVKNNLPEYCFTAILKNFSKEYYNKDGICYHDDIEGFKIASEHKEVNGSCFITNSSGLYVECLYVVQRLVFTISGVFQDFNHFGIMTLNEVLNLLKINESTETLNEFCETEIEVGKYHTFVNFNNNDIVNHRYVITRIK